MPWDGMRGDQRTRFCEKCQLHVHNLSSMTSDEAEALVGERSDRICVAYAPSSDGSPLTLNYEKRKRRFTWRVTLAIGLLGATATTCAQALFFRTKPVPPAPARFLGKVYVAGAIAPPPRKLGLFAAPRPSPPPCSPTENTP
jgi:hypothetical protein